MKNRKGISSIIATLILLLLTIVLVGIVWAVVSGIVKTSTEGATSGTQCFNSAVDITSASCTKAGVCNLTVQRTLGTDVLGGLRAVFLDKDGVGNVTDIEGDLQTLGTARLVSKNMGIKNVSEVDVAIYFTDTAGNKNVCSSPTKYTNVQLI
ncbi:MAG: hypothetical protein PHH00_01900 [Candidatus Nanoarchaeia archaeon]|nr:hypothetical protein [Candidatus Nanoarchaeia archaeon]